MVVKNENNINEKLKNEDRNANTIFKWQLKDFNAFCNWFADAKVISQIIKTALR